MTLSAINVFAILILYINELPLFLNLIFISKNRNYGITSKFVKRKNSCAYVININMECMNVVGLCLEELKNI